MDFPALTTRLNSTATSPHNPFQLTMCHQPALESISQQFWGAVEMLLEF